MSGRRPDAASEQRLEQLRREAEKNGVVGGEGLRPPGAPMPVPEGSYYGLPLLKPPVWTWEVPAYFFVGGTAGAAACIAAAARIGGADARLISRARWVAAAGGALSGPLLIADLGRPERFLAMLRVFKPQSPMSVGAWLLPVFGTATGAAVVFRGRLGDLASGVAAVTGLGIATYTGVLIGATAIPVWSRHAAVLPALFGASALGSAASTLELLGARHPALHRLAVLAAGAETVIGSAIESDRDVASAPLRRGTTGIATRLASAFSGPIPLLIRALWGRSHRARSAAAVSSIVGSLLTRVAWVEAGRQSAAEPQAALRGRDAARVRHPVGEGSASRQDGGGKPQTAGQE